jgi:hypothetical protein
MLSSALLMIISWREIAPQRYFIRQRQLNGHKTGKPIRANARRYGRLGLRLTAAAGQTGSYRGNKKPSRKSSQRG